MAVPGVAIHFRQPPAGGKTGTGDKIGPPTGGPQTGIYTTSAITFNSHE
ncbi:MAG TPA: hypothetical protein VFE47_04480 [Tepidisphaeraceae bacterium]|jgi:hypothetical protein|nr:hypothetical protein [Tepidisphaeraceae bacterium]